MTKYEKMLAEATIPDINDQFAEILENIRKLPEREKKKLKKTGVIAELNTALVRLAEACDKLSVTVDKTK